MFIVPLSGDKLVLKSGLPSKVLSFTNYKSEGPAVMAEALGGGSQVVYFDDIDELEGQKVKVVKNDKGYNVLEIDGVLHRDYKLPQVGESIESDISGIEPRWYSVKRLKLHVKGKLTKGLILDCQEKDSDEIIEVPISKVLNVKHCLFSKSKFQTYYSDYCEKGSI